MSKNSGNGTSTPSTYSVTKSFGGYYKLGAAYGLKPGEEDEIGAIIGAFKEADAAGYEDD